MMKVIDWEAKLTQFVEAKRHEPFSWGTNDCFFFAMDCVAMLRGVDVAAEFRGKYKSLIAAVKLQAKHGSTKWLDQHFIRFDNNNLIQRGSIVCYMHETHNPPEALGICIGTEFIAPGKDGIEFLPMSQVVTGWRV
jgi:hypothetical protein